jgi:ABC-type multidrug transport system fused ATPase/permease subunit
VVFTGTLRFNLDPFGQYSDEQLWKALDVTHLKTYVSKLEDGLQHTVSEGGANLRFDMIIFIREGGGVRPPSSQYFY